MTASGIPIRNIYYLLCYAWNRLPESNVVDVSRLQSTELADLFAHVLIGGVRHVARRGLEKGYEEHSDELRSVRGRVNVLESARRFLLRHGRASCSYDELTVNTPANRIVKATLRHLAGVPSLDRHLKTELLALYRSLSGVDSVALSSRLFRTIQLHSNNGYYRFLLNVCEFVCDAWLVDQKTGDYRFRDFLRDEDRMALVFQSFVFNFLRLERPDLAPRVEYITWRVESETDPALALLPRMETDISLVSQTDKLIIDTKYYAKTLQERYDKESIHSANLYQMFAYLMNVPDENRKVSGMLLYPVVTRALRESYRFQGKVIRVCTVDLSQDWPEIRDELLRLVA